MSKKQIRRVAIIGTGVIGASWALGRNIRRCFIERAEQIGMGRVASELVAEDVTTP